MSDDDLLELYRRGLEENVTVVSPEDCRQIVDAINAAPKPQPSLVELMRLVRPGEILSTNIDGFVFSHAVYERWE